MTSDDTKVDTSDWQHLKPYGYAPGSYMNKCHYCKEIYHDLDKRAITCRQCAEHFLAIQSLPKVTAERDALVIAVAEAVESLAFRREAVEKTAAIAQAAISERNAALFEVSALSARVKELTEGLRTACGMLSSCGFESPEDDPELAASWQASVDKVSALIGKEPS